MNFKDKVFWITGASSGIGEALVHACVERGAIVVASSNEMDGLQKVKTACGKDGERIITVPFDLANTAEISSIVSDVLEKTGSIDYLVNLGGVSQRATIEDTPLWLDRKIMEINFFGTIALSKAVLPYMLRKGSGHILVTSSIAGRFGFPLRSAYSSSKQALHGFIETLHLENNKKGVRGSAIIPGRVKTNISFNALDKEGKSHGKMDQGLAGGVSPRHAAERILKGIRKNQREILIGRSELIMLYIRKYFPWLFFRLAARIKPT